MVNKIGSISLLPKLTPAEIYEELDRFVIGQDKAKRTISIAIYNHIKRTNAILSGRRTILKKTNIMFIGPTGCGKTHIARQISRILNLPMVIVDATEYTEAGYYGKDVEVMVGELLYATGQDVTKTERGIIFIDEIDKIARRGGGLRTGAGARDIGGEGVQQSLLKLLEGSRIFVPHNLTQHWNEHEFTPVDTTNILFIAAGTFSDIATYSDDTNKEIGFGAEGKDKDKKVRKSRITQKKLIEYGMLPELLGRIPVLVQLHQLNEDALVKILTEPPDSIVREYKQLLREDGIRLEFSDAALKMIASYAASKGLGARALRGIMEEVLHDVLFEAPSMKRKKIKITRNYVKKRIEQIEEEGIPVG